MQQQFHERFGIEIGMGEAKRRFINRIINHVKQTVFAAGYLQVSTFDFLASLSNALGEPFDSVQARLQWDDLLEKYVGSDFHRALRVLEVLYPIAELQRDKVSRFATDLLRNSEVDLGLRWQDGVFVKTGAELLDSALVKDPMNWLRRPELKTVREPFEKGLTHYLGASQNSAL